MRVSTQKILNTCILSAVIWIAIIQLVALDRYSISIRFERETTYFEQLWSIWPWYVSWIWFTPIIIFVARVFFSEKTPWLQASLKHLLIVVCFLPCYLLSVGAVAFWVNGKLVESTNFTEGLILLATRNTWAYDLSIYTAVMLSAHISIYLQKIRTKEKENDMLQVELYKSQLVALKSQLNPHFLFNALNTISGLMRMQANDKATLALSELSYMLRSVLEKKDNLVELREEIKFVEKYIFFQTLRFERFLSSSFSVQPESLEVQFPFLLLHTLVENAVKHGAQEEGCENTITLTVVTEHGRLKIEMYNNMATEHRYESFGIGLLNCQKRLALLYKDDFLLSCDKQSDKEYLTKVDIPAVYRNV